MYLRILTNCFEINYRENPILYLRIENTGTHLVNFVITLIVTEGTNLFPFLLTMLSRTQSHLDFNVSAEFPQYASIV